MPQTTRSRVHVFDIRSLPRTLGYQYLTDSGIIPGCVHYVLMAFARRFRYNRYLFIENDVEYTGDWSTLADICLEANNSLLAAHIYRHQDRPDWPLWYSLRKPDGKQLPTHQLVKAFMPIYSVTFNALSLVDKSHRNGWSGHHEVIMPTLLSLHGMAIQDFNEFGQMYTGDEQDARQLFEGRTLSTLRWRPQITLAEFKNRFQRDTFYHPVKEMWTWTRNK